LRSRAGELDALEGKLGDASGLKASLTALGSRVRELEAEKEAWEKAREELAKKHAAQVEELRAQLLALKTNLMEIEDQNRRLIDNAEALEMRRVEAMAKLVKNQVQIVVSAPCVRLNIGGQSDDASTVTNAPPDKVMAEVRRVLEHDDSPSLWLA